MQTLLTVIFFVSFHEFIRIVKIKVPLWWAKHRHQADGEMLLTALHDDEGIVSPLSLTDFPSEVYILLDNKPMLLLYTVFYPV